MKAKPGMFRDGCPTCGVKADHHHCIACNAPVEWLDDFPGHARFDPNMVPPDRIEAVLAALVGEPE